MEKKTRKEPTEQEVRLHVRKLAIEHYAKNGLGDLSPKEVQQRLLQIEAKAKKAIGGAPKQDNKLLGSKKSIGNSMANAKWMLGKPKKSKDVKGSIGGDKMKNIKTHQMSPGKAKFNK